MTRDTFATIRATNEKLTQMIRQASAGFHDDLYLRVIGEEDRVEFLASSNGRQVISYCTFSGLKLVEGSGEAILPTGIDNDTRGILDYLGIVEGSGTIEMTLEGEEGDGEHPRLAEHWHVEGKLEGTVRLPGSEDDLKHVPWHIPDRFYGDDERYISSSAFDETGDEIVADEPLEYAPETVIETTVQSVQDGVIEPANFMDEVGYYPLVVEDEVARLDLQGNEGDDSLTGEIHTESVEGPDVSRRFDEGFEELFDEITGPVRLATAPATGGAGPSPPLVVVQNNLTDETQRHIVGPFAED